MVSHFINFGRHVIAGFVWGTHGVRRRKLNLANFPASGSEELSNPLRFG